MHALGFFFKDPFFIMSGDEYEGLQSLVDIIDGPFSKRDPNNPRLWVCGSCGAGNMSFRNAEIHSLISRDACLRRQLDKALIKRVIFYFCGAVFILFFCSFSLPQSLEMRMYFSSSRKLAILLYEVRFWFV